MFVQANADTFIEVVFFLLFVALPVELFEFLHGLAPLSIKLGIRGHLVVLVFDLTQPCGKFISRFSFRPLT